MPKLMQLLGERGLAREQQDVSNGKSSAAQSDSTIRAFFKELFSMVGRKKEPKVQGTLPYAHLIGIPGPAKPATSRKSKDVGLTDASRNRTAEWSGSRKNRPSSTAGIIPTVGSAGTSERLNRAMPKSSLPSRPAPSALGDAIQDERRRIAKIMAYGIKNGCVNQAGVFAFDTDMTAAQAIDAIAAHEMDRRNSTRFDRAALYVKAEQTTAGSVSPTQEISPADLAAKITAAADKARGNPHYARETVSNMMARGRTDATAQQAAAIVTAAAKARGEIQPKE